MSHHLDQSTMESLLNSIIWTYVLVREFKSKAPEQMLISLLDICFEIVKDFVPLKKTLSIKRKGKEGICYGEVVELMSLYIVLNHYHEKIL